MFNRKSGKDDDEKSQVAMPSNPVSMDNEADSSKSSHNSEKAEKKVREGWIRTWMMIEALAVSEDAVKDALEKHVKKMAMEKNVLVSKRDFKKIEKVEKPFPNIQEAYSGVVELEVLAQDYDKLVIIVLNYAPSAIEILEPKKISMDAGEAQGILNSLSDLIHRFVGMTRGAVMVDTK